VHFLDELLEHLLRHGEVGDDAVFHRADHGDVARRLAEHLFRFLADRLDGALRIRPAFLADGDNRRFVEDDAFAAYVDQRVRGAKIDREVIGEVGAQESEHVEIVLLDRAPPVGAIRNLAIIPESKRLF
jgi:hypothetical protein